MLKISWTKWWYIGFVDSNPIKNDKEFMLNCINKNHNAYYQLWWYELENDNDIIKAFEESEKNYNMEKLKKEHWFLNIKR